MVDYLNAQRIIKMLNYNLRVGNAKNVEDRVKRHTRELNAIHVTIIFVVSVPPSDIPSSIYLQI
jgi:hypothetical protein